MLILLLIKNDHPEMIGKTYKCIKYKNNFNFISRRIVNWFPELHNRCWKRPNRLQDPSQITLQSVTNRCIVKRWLLEARAPPNNRWWCIKISTYSPAHLSSSFLRNGSAMIEKTYTMHQIQKHLNFIPRRIVNWSPKLHNRCWKRPNSL